MAAAGESDYSDREKHATDSRNAEPRKSVDPTRCPNSACRLTLTLTLWSGVNPRHSRCPAGLPWPVLLARQVVRPAVTSCQPPHRAPLRLVTRIGRRMPERPEGGTVDLVAFGSRPDLAGTRRSPVVTTVVTASGMSAKGGRRDRRSCTGNPAGADAPAMGSAGLTGFGGEPGEETRDGPSRATQRGRVRQGRVVRVGRGEPSRRCSHVAQQLRQQEQREPADQARENKTAVFPNS